MQACPYDAPYMALQVPCMSFTVIMAANLVTWPAGLGRCTMEKTCRWTPRFFLVAPWESFFVDTWSWQIAMEHVICQLLVLIYFWATFEWVDYVVEVFWTTKSCSGETARWCSMKSSATFSDQDGGPAFKISQGLLSHIAAWQIFHALNDVLTSFITYLCCVTTS